jgi:hypothetical protein
MKSLYLLVVVAVISFTSCRTKEGAPGPAGETNLIKQGFIAGTVTYTNSNGNNAQAPFSYTYYESLDDNKFYFDDDSEGDYYEVSFDRRDLKDNNNNFSFDVYGYGTNGEEEDPESGDMNFSVRTIVNGELLEFYGSGGTITNVNLNPATGRLTFDYTNSSVQFANGPATLTAKVDVILYRSPNYVLSL